MINGRHCIRSLSYCVKREVKSPGKQLGYRVILSTPHLDVDLVSLPALRRLTDVFNLCIRGTETKQNKHECNHKSVEKYFGKLQYITEHTPHIEMEKHCGLHISS